MQQRVEAYSDLRHPEYLISRNRELPLYIARLIEDFSLPVAAIREVVQLGPGLGHETEVLRAFFPGVNLVSVDSNPEAVAIASRSANVIVQDDGLNYLGKMPTPLENARLVIALRTSPEIVQGLLRMPCAGDIRIASLVGPKQAEDDLVAALRRQRIPMVAIEERRGFYDFAFRLS